MGSTVHAAILLAGIIAWGGSSVGFAQNAAPARKDSPARTKPKDAVLTIAADPAEARPGGTVVLTVTAKLKPGFHIYQYSKEDNDVGPKNTRFDLFDTAGLVVVRDWTAAREPTKKKEPAFPELERVSFYENEIAWSVKLQVPEDAPPGKKTLRCQASYQICNDQSCSFPGRWTLPDAVVTILPAAQLKATVEAPPAAVEAKIAQPKSPDSPANLKPKPIAVTATLNVPEARPGDVVHLAVSAALEPGWHVYDYAKSQPDEGPARLSSTCSRRAASFRAANGRHRRHRKSNLNPRSIMSPSPFLRAKPPGFCR